MRPVVVVEVKRHKNGKLFPPTGYRSPEEIQRIVRLVHRMRCTEYMQFRQIVAELAQEGYRVSLGSVYRYWADFGPCRDCPDG